MIKPYYRFITKRGCWVFILSLLLSVITGAGVNAQAARPLTIEECYTLGKQNYPLIKQRQLIENSKEYSVSNAAKGYLPQVSFNGQATYQSAVTGIPSNINIPGIPLSSIIPAQYKDQYKIYAEADQTIYDGGNIKYQKQSQETNALIQQQNLEVNLYALKDRINQLFFGILLIDEQLKQNDIQQNDIQNGIDKTQALINNGTAFRSSLDELKAELLKAGQDRVELQANRKAFLDMLALFINRSLTDDTRLEKPQPQTLTDSIYRPELTLYEYQKRNYTIHDKLLQSTTLPQLQFFVQGGYGRPGLNAFNPDFALYYIGGLRLNWSLSSLYTYKNNLHISAINRKDLDIQKETFLFNTHLTLKQQSADVIKYSALISRDDAIISLRASVKNATAAQLTNGVATAHDYITQLNAEDQARQTFILHEIQLLQAEYNYQTTSGN
jgi:outer membrane protein TolC